MLELFAIAGFNDKTTIHDFELWATDLCNRYDTTASKWIGCAFKYIRGDKGNHDN